MIERSISIVAVMWGCWDAMSWNVVFVVVKIAIRVRDDQMFIYKKPNPLLMNLSMIPFSIQIGLQFKIKPLQLTNKIKIKMYLKTRPHWALHRLKIE